MKDSNQIIPIKLSNQFTIYKTKYDREYSKEDFLQVVELNKSLPYIGNFKDDHSLTLNIECKEFKSVDNFFIRTLDSLFDIKTDKVSKHSWIYTQTQDFSADWMHNHKNLHRFVETKYALGKPTPKSYISTTWVCVFYIQIPDKLENGKGDLLFSTEDNKTHRITPEENEIVIFSGDLNHMTLPTDGIPTKRISYVSNFNFNIW